ncbi:MAG: LysM peptidoglycan-binding domain-containing protein, partial [Steroidobacteraceae bacterium]
QLNPSLMPPVWMGSKHIPSGFPLRVPGSVDQLAALRDLPSSAVATTQVVDHSHRVRKGETLSVIAAKYKVSTQQLAKLNGLRQPYRIVVGKVLKLPGAVTTVLASAAAPMVAIDKNNEQALYHTVKRGDTLGKIAQHYSVSQSELLALNTLRNANQVLLGQKLLIRAAGPQPANAAEPDEQEVTPTTLARAEKVEPKSETEAEALGPTLLPGVQAAASADPADYAVGKGNTIRVEASETLGHYADWLNTTPTRLRSLNKLSAKALLPLGKTLKLDFSRVTTTAFETKRQAYHQQLQESFFAEYRIVDSTTYVLKQGDSVWLLLQKASNVPMWLLRQYNPDVELGDVRPGTKLVIPRVEAIEG